MHTCDDDRPPGLSVPIASGQPPAPSAPATTNPRGSVPLVLYYAPLTHSDKPVPQAAVATDLQVCRFRVRRTAPLPDRARPQPPSRIGRDPQDPHNVLRDPRRNNMFEKYRHKTSPHTVWFEIKAMECSPNPGLIQPGAWTSVSTPLGVQQKITAAMGNAKPWIYNPREPQRTSLHPRQRHDVGYSHSP